MTNEEINRAVAAIAGWTEIENWNTSATKKTYIGTNATHPELRKFIPNYVESLDAIVKVFESFKICYRLIYLPAMHGTGSACRATTLTSPIEYDALSPALALCKLLLAINPTPIAPPQVAIIDDDGEHD
jgi:hypothetical protein